MTEELHRAVMAFLASTKAKLLVLSQEDLFLEKAQLNLPGTITEHPNWSRKMRYSIEELWEHPDVQKMARLFRAAIDGSGRGIKGSGRGGG